MIEFSCPHCGACFKCDESHAGKSRRCGSCHRDFVVPAMASPATSTIPPAPTHVVAANPAAVQSAPPAPIQADHLERETLQSLVHNTVVLVALAAAQSLVEYLPGTDIVLGGVGVGGWIRLAMAIAILVLMFRLLRPLRTVVPYYVGLIFRTQTKLANQPELRANVSSAATYFILVAYVAVIYWAVLPSMLGIMAALLSFQTTVLKMTRLGVALVGIVFVVKLVLALRPLLSRVSSKITDRAMEATQKADSKNCPNCGAQIALASQFCAACGKPVSRLDAAELEKGGRSP